jgi:uncharacterized protein (DUF934 family)
MKTSKPFAVIEATMRNSCVPSLTFHQKKRSDFLAVYPNFNRLPFQTSRVRFSLSQRERAEALANKVSAIFRVVHLWGERFIYGQGYDAARFLRKTIGFNPKIKAHCT